MNGESDSDLSPFHRLRVEGTQHEPAKAAGLPEQGEAFTTHEKKVRNGSAAKAKKPATGTPGERIAQDGGSPTEEATPVRSK